MTTAYIRTNLKAQKIEKVRIELGDVEMIALESHYLRCALFYDAQKRNIFIQKFKDDMTNQHHRFYLDYSVITVNIEMAVQKWKFKLGSTCDRLIVNNKILYIYQKKDHVEYWDNPSQYRHRSLYEWIDIPLTIKDSLYISSDHALNLFIVENDLIKLFYQDAIQIYQDKDDEYYSSLSYTDYSSQFLQTVELIDYQISIQQQLFDTSGDESMKTYDEKIIVFGTKFVNQGYKYILIILETKQAAFRKVDTKFGFSLIKPNFITCQQLKRIIVYGVASDELPLYEGYYFNLEKNILEKLQFPVSNTNDFWHLFISSTYLYARSANSFEGLFYQSSFMLLNQSIYPYVEKSLISESYMRKNWDYSIIQASKDYAPVSFMKAEMTVFHIYGLTEFFRQFSYRKITFLSFQKMQQKDEKQNNLFQFKAKMINSENKIEFQVKEPLIISSQIGYRWIYPEFRYNQTNDRFQVSAVVIINYNIINGTNDTVKLELDFQGQFYFKSYMVSPQIDCFYVINQEKKMIVFFQIDGLQVNRAYEMGYERTPNSGSEVTLGPSCKIVKWFNQIYYRVIGSDSSKKLQEINDLSLKTNDKFSFDSSLQFAIQGDRLYKFKGKNYEIIFKYQFLSQNVIMASKDFTKLAIQTYTNMTENVLNVKTGQNTTKKYWKCQLMRLYYTEGKWIEIEQGTNMSVKAVSFIKHIQVSPSFEKAVICFLSYTNASQSICYYSSVNYSSKKQASKSIKLDMKQYRKLLILNVQNNYVYSMTARHSIINKKVYVFDCLDIVTQAKLDSHQILVQEGIECKTYQQNFQKRRVYENLVSQQHTYYFVNEYVASDSVILIKTILKNLNNYYNLPYIFIYDTGLFQKDKGFYKCQAGCIQCQSFYVCIRCAFAYVLDFSTNLCKKCNGYCKTCDANNLSVCFSCFDGFYYDMMSSRCLQCPSNCLTCLGKTQDRCTNCIDGFFYSNGSQKSLPRTCVPCSSNCILCNNSKTCIDCETGYDVNKDGVCIKCPLECSSCNVSQISECIQCSTGFYLANVEGKKYCQKCPNLCNVCTNTSDCLICHEAAIYIPQKQICSIVCFSPCITCSINDPHECTSCLSNYKLEGKQCLPNISCSDDSSCVSCPSGYTLVAQKCFKCVVQDNCAQCHSVDPTQCVSCKSGFHLIYGKCEPCLTQNCSNCYSSNICMLCKQGYYLFYYPRISLTGSACLKCSDNYYKLIGATCVSIKIINFSLKLNLQITNFNHEIFTQLINEIAQMLNKSQTNVKIFSLKNGSVIVEGSIDTKDPTDESNALLVLNAELTQGSKIANQEVLESKFVGYTPLTTTIVAPQESSSNLVLILATTIPGTLIIIALIAIIIYKKFFDRNNADLRRVDAESDRSSTSTEMEDRKRKNRKKNNNAVSKNVFGQKIPIKKMESAEAIWNKASKQIS